jgi:hypothetical protein
MLGRLAKATYLLTLALMIVAYALSAGRAVPGEPSPPVHAQQIDYWNI